MRTADEIKVALECCAKSECAYCPYKDCESYDECTGALAADAIIYILQAEKELKAYRWYNSKEEE